MKDISHIMKTVRTFESVFRGAAFLGLLCLLRLLFLPDWQALPQSTRHWADAGIAFIVVAFFCASEGLDRVTRNQPKP